MFFMRRKPSKRNAAKANARDIFIITDVLASVVEEKLTGGRTKVFDTIIHARMGTTDKIIDAYFDSTEAIKNANLLKTTLKKAGLNTFKNKMTITCHPKHAEGVNKALKQLETTNLINQANFQVLMKNKKNAADIATCLTSLNKKKLLNQEIFNRLIENAKYAVNIAGVVDSLEEKLVSPRNCTAILSKANYTRNIAKTLTYLKDSHVMSQANFETVLQHAEQLEGINSLLEEGKNAALPIVDFTFAIQNLEHVSHISASLKKLLASNLLLSSANDLLPPADSEQKLKNFALLMKYPQLLPEISLEIQKSTPLTQAVFEGIIKKMGNNLKQAFLMGTDSKLGVNSALIIFGTHKGSLPNSRSLNNPFADQQVLNQVFKFL